MGTRNRAGTSECGPPDRDAPTRTGPKLTCPRDTISVRPRSKLKRHPVGDDLRTGVALERLEGAVDGRKRADQACPIECRRQPRQDRLKIGIRKPALVGAG